MYFDSRSRTYVVEAQDRTFFGFLESQDSVPADNSLTLMEDTVDALEDARQNEARLAMMEPSPEKSDLVYHSSLRDRLIDDRIKAMAACLIHDIEIDLSDR